jgi:hypothetical protein
MAKAREGSALRSKWQKELDSAHKRFSEKLHLSGDRVLDQYMLEKTEATGTDKLQNTNYNILYSNTETIRPSLYGQTPKPMVAKRDIDNNDNTSLAATLILEKAIEYQMSIQEGGFDTIFEQAVEDYLLPGLGQVWARYIPTFNETGDVEYEKTGIDYVYWKDFRHSRGRVWNEVWWVSRCAWMDKAAFTKRFPDIAKTGKVSFNQSNSTSKTEKQDIDSNQVCVWEVWDKRAKQVIWFCDEYEDDVLEAKDDILKLEGFFPCPRPLRAVTTNRTALPRPFFSQYQKQAEELNDITHRIRLLTDGLRLVAIYDASQDKLAHLFSGRGNKVIAVDNWAMMAEKGGIKGTIDFFPIQEIANVLLQLYQARQEIKNEIYEITGWSDIIRGVSKASETLGAQQIKSDWAGARIKKMQREIQRFIRDTLRIVGEIVSEHFQPETLMLITGLASDLQRAPPEIQQRMMQTFPAALKILKDEKQRCALIDIETDSTLVPDEANDKQERMEFVGSVGAFLQQAVPAMTAYPPVGPLLLDILNFAVKGFRAARPLQDSFEQFTQKIKSGEIPPPQDPKAQAAQGKPADGGAAKAQVALQVAGIQDAQAKAELSLEQQQHNDEMAFNREKEQNRHAEVMLKLKIEAAKLGLVEDDQRHDQQLEVAGHNHAVQSHSDNMAQAQTELAVNQQGAAEDRDFQAQQSEADRAANRGLDAKP